MKLVTSRVRKISGTIAAVFLLSFVAMPSFQAQDVAQDTQSAPLGSAAMQQLVAPIALYPDALIAQVLAASTFQIRSSRRIVGCRSIQSGPETN